MFDHTFFLPAHTTMDMHLASPFVLRVVSFLRDQSQSSDYRSSDLSRTMFSLLDPAGYMASLRWFFFIGTYRCEFRRHYRELRKYVYMPMWAERTYLQDCVFLEDEALGAAAYDLDPSSFPPPTRCPTCKQKPSSKWWLTEGPPVPKEGTKSDAFQPFNITWFQCPALTCRLKFQFHRPAELVERRKGWYFDGNKRMGKVEGPGQWAVFSARPEDLTGVDPDDHSDEDEGPDHIYERVGSTKWGKKKLED